MTPVQSRQLPLAQSMWYSLTKWNGLSDPVFIGLDNFSRALADPNFIRAFQNTAIWLIVAVTVPTILGLLPLALSLLWRAYRLSEGVVLLEEEPIAPDADGN